jgi:hypothetical protein
MMMTQDYANEALVRSRGVFIDNDWNAEAPDGAQWQYSWIIGMQKSFVNNEIDAQR